MVRFKGREFNSEMLNDLHSEMAQAGLTSQYPTTVEELLGDVK